jgi:splicing factor 3B subunit 2
MDDAAVAARYEQQMAAQRAQAAPEDFSDMVKEQAQRAKRKAAAKQKESDAKKFKF